MHHRHTGALQEQLLLPPRSRLLLLLEEAADGLVPFRGIVAAVVLHHKFSAVLSFVPMTPTLAFEQSRLPGYFFGLGPVTTFVTL